MAGTERRELYSEKLTSGGRTYFFDVKESKDGTRYLVISESRATGDGHEHSRVMLFEESFKGFHEQYLKAMEFLGLVKKPARLDAIKKKHPKAYQRWTPAEDSSLKERYAQGTTMRALAERFQRQPSAIRSRLVKLGLMAADTAAAEKELEGLSAREATGKRVGK